jgi:putative oxidoreductase
MSTSIVTRVSTSAQPVEEVRSLPAGVARAHTLLDTHSIDVLRVSLGSIFLVFGLLKFVPGLSPAADLAARTIETLTFGIVSGDVAILLTAAMETFIGITLVTGRFLKLGLVTLAMAMGGILSPLVLFTGELFPSGGPTLLAQYILKDFVLISAGLVVGAHALGARLVRR